MFIEFQISKPLLYKLKDLSHDIVISVREIYKGVGLCNVYVYLFTYEEVEGANLWI